MVAIINKLQQEDFVVQLESTLSAQTIIEYLRRTCPYNWVAIDGQQTQEAAKNVNP